MTLSGAIAVILRYCAENGTFTANYVTAIKVRDLYCLRHVTNVAQRMYSFRQYVIYGDFAEVLSKLALTTCTRIRQRKFKLCNISHPREL